ncbi:MAG TPA: nitroreductase family protein [Acidimicrobiales bacterium]|nr:nitroreductase family protein [Acidimicrobiales bacterium]
MTDGGRPPFDLEETDRLLSTTRAVRKRLDLDRPVPREVVLDCVRLAAYAPNASNAQRWRWLVVTDPDLRAELGAMYRAHIVPPMEALLAQRRRDGDAAGVRHSESVLHLGAVFDRVPVIVAPCIEGHIDDDPTLNGASWLLGSIYQAVWSFQLALRSRGLGSTFTTAHVLFEPEVCNLLGVPDTHTVTCLIPVAYTIGTDFRPAPRAPAEDVTYWDRWLGS